MTGLDSREDGGFGGWVGRWWSAFGFLCCGLGFLLLAFEFFDEDGGEAFALCWSGDFCGGCEGAEFGVGGDFFDRGGIAGGFGLAGDVEAGDLESVEEQSGALGVDFVAGDATEDFADGGLDGAAVFGDGDVEFGLLGAAASGVSGGAAGGVVVVAELLLLEAGAAAAVSVGEDVAALIAFGGF
ncbi:MAG TPA: hypothetical protein VNX60_06785 [Candidatus Acidoferrum sp.]|nr:hypothetical protein [Candidatus Acidoferrum sp.]